MYYYITSAIISGVAVKRREAFLVRQLGEQVHPLSPPAMWAGVVGQGDAVVIEIEVSDQLVAIATFDIELEADQMLVAEGHGLTER